MTEEEPKKKPEESPQENIDIDAAANDMIAKANQAAERLEGANKELSLLLSKQEQLKVEATFGGSAEAGKQESTEEQKADAAARKLVEGTGFEEDLFPEKKKESFK